jgi:hypothetical protein
MFAFFIAARKSGSSAASIVIWVKNTMSSGSFGERAPSARSARRASPSAPSSRPLSCASRRHREVSSVTGIEVVVGERDEPEAAPAQVDDSPDHTASTVR